MDELPWIKAVALNGPLVASVMWSPHQPLAAGVGSPMSAAVVREVTGGQIPLREPFAVAEGLLPGR